MRTCFAAFLLCLATQLFAQAKRSLQPSDIYRLQSIADPQISPDGAWVAYSLSSVDSAKDRRNNDLWMVSWNGAETVQLTNSPEGESSPRWSPDGKFLSFVSARQGGPAQVWLLDRRGGEAVKLTEVKGELTDYEWSPDAKKLVLVLKDPVDSGKNKLPKPYVINRYRFKQDVSGYLWDTRSNHLYLFDVGSKKLDTLTKGIYNESDPRWSPDGSKIAFVSNRTEDPDKNSNSDIWLIDAKPGAVMKQFTTWKGSDAAPQWSPDGRWIAYTRSTADEAYIMYDQPVLAVQSVDGGEPRLLTSSLDRPVSNHRWSRDGKTVFALVSDDLQRKVVSFDAANGKMQILYDGDRSFSSLAVHPAGGLLLTLSTTQLPSELYAAEKNNLRRLTTVHEKFVTPLTLATVEKFVSASNDGTKISGLLFYPPNAPKEKLPLLFYIHGGPVAQDEFSFDLTRQMLAAHGYAVAAVNYRGSNGRGLAFSKAIYADWGNKEVADILGAADYLVAKGVADPARMGISGWSYGGILTNYTIAKDKRFKVASSGAGSALQLSLYGVDQYILQLDNELGQPWKDNNVQKYLELSYPFLHADRISTPTQFMTGEKDFNVPAIGSEQMYQALRSLNVPTELIVYPGQFHGFTQPSFIKDRFERYFAWFDKYLGKPRL